MAVRCSRSTRSCTSRSSGSRVPVARAFASGAASSMRACSRAVHPETSFSRSNHGVRERDEHDLQVEQSKKRKQAVRSCTPRQSCTTESLPAAPSAVRTSFSSTSRASPTRKRPNPIRPAVLIRAASGRAWRANLARWAWSCGNTLAADAPPTAAEALNAVLESNSEPTAGPVAGAARVLSQWVFKNSAARR